MAWQGHDFGAHAHLRRVCSQRGVNVGRKAADLNAWRRFYTRVLGF